MSPCEKWSRQDRTFFIMIKGSFYQYEEAFAVFSSVFRGVVDRNAPLKQKMVHGNNAPFSAWNESFFTWPAIFMEKQKSLLIKTRDSKISYGCGSQQALFFNLNHTKLSLPDVFDELIFLNAFSFLPKSVSSSHHRTNTHLVGVLKSPNQINSK